MLANITKLIHLLRPSKGKLRLAFLLIILSSIHASEAQLLRVNTFPFELVNEARYHVFANGQSLPVMHLGQNVYAVSFDFQGSVDMAVKVEVSDLILENLYFWKAIEEKPKQDADYFRGRAIVRPLSKNVSTETIKNETTFTINSPGQYTLEAPGVSKYKDEVLLIFANGPEVHPPHTSDRNIIYLKSGLHKDNVTLRSNQTLYLESGAVLVGAINVWDAKHVKIRGRGTVLFQEPLRYGRDNGPFNIPNQHALTTSNVQDLSVEGVTFVVRSQTWSVQLVRTHGVLFDNVKIVNLTTTNIGGDGIDWMDSGQGRVIHSFIRSADDNLALLSADALKDFRPTDPTKVEHFGTLRDITVSDCVFWNTFGSILRMGWTSQSLTTSNITLKNIDIIHGHSLMVIGIPKRIAHANHSDYLFESLRFEESAKITNWESDPTATFSNFIFKDLTLGNRPDGKYGTESRSGVTFQNITILDPELR